MSIDRTHVQTARALSEATLSAEQGLTAHGACSDGNAASENCLADANSSFTHPGAKNIKTAFLMPNELRFDEPQQPIIRVDVPVPGTADDRLQPIVPITFGDNPYIDNQTPPYKPDVPTHPVQWGRPGETFPTNIEKPNEFAHNFLSAVQTAAARIQTVDDCARGIREGLNDMNMGFKINDDMTFNGDKYRWRSAVQFGDYLSKSGLFDSYPLDKVQNKLEDGMIVVRHWNDGLIKARGEDRGDICVVSHNGYQYNDHSQPYEPHTSRYNGGYVLVPKGYAWENKPIEFHEAQGGSGPHGRGRGHGGGHAGGGGVHQGGHRRHRA